MVYRSKSLLLFLLLIAVVYCQGTSNVRADTREESIASSREYVKQQLDPARLGVGYGALMNFSAEPMLSSATYHVAPEEGEESVIYLHKIPIRQEFTLNGPGSTAFIEANFGYLNMEQNLKFSDSDPDKFATSNWKAYSGTIGAGIKIPLSKGFFFEPALDGGIVYLKNDAKYYGEFANNYLKPVFKGIAFDWSTNAVLLSGMATLGYEQMWNDFQLDIKLSYSFNYINTYNESSSYQKFSTNINVTSTKIDITHPLGIALYNLPLSWIFHAGNNTFVGPNHNALDFTYLFELGFSLKADISRKDWMIKSVSLGAMGITGDNVNGWSILFGYHF